jgi:NAD-dependent dihydropyrimidine dehydrogenase PreA subunit
MPWVHRSWCAARQGWERDRNPSCRADPCGLIFTHPERKKSAGRLARDIFSILTVQTCQEVRTVAYVISEPCIGVKDNSCVEVCPVDCIHPTPDEPDYEQAEQLYIDPQECIDCDACVEACPVDAITSEDQVPEEWQRFIELNASYYRDQAA